METYLFNKHSTNLARFVKEWHGGTVRGGSIGFGGSLFLRQLTETLLVMSGSINTHNVTLQLYLDPRHGNTRFSSQTLIKLHKIASNNCLNCKQVIRVNAVLQTTFPQCQC